MGKVEDLKWIKIIQKDNERNFLYRIIRLARKRYKNPIDFIDDFIDQLNQNEDLRAIFIMEVQPVFKDISMRTFLTDFGIFSKKGLWAQFTKQISDKVLPQVYSDSSLLSLINEVLYSKKFYIYVKRIPVDRWIKLYEVLFSNGLTSDKEYVKSTIREASLVLVDRIIGDASSPEMMKLSDLVTDVEGNPFQKLAKLMIDTLQEHHFIDNQKLSDFKVSIQACSAYLNSIVEQKHRRGISLSLTIQVTRLRQQLKRLRILLRMIYLLDNESVSYSLGNITHSWLRFYSPKNGVISSLKSTLYVYTFLITWHNGQTGEKYITTNAKEYWKMLYSAMGGGFLVALLCIFKIDISKSNSVASSQALLYSLNYAWGFMLIYLMHWTLATKQPAMTAAALAHTLKKDETKEEEEERDYKEFALVFARLFRSQFISFVGNIIAVVPAGVGFYYLFKRYFPSINPIDDHKAEEFISEAVQWDWQIFVYASIAGVFLFLSGMISGLIDNNNRYNNIPERIFQHPLLKKFFKEKTRAKIALWYEKRIAGIMGNVFLGFCLGCAFLIGKFFHIVFDIRHITFSGGNFAIALAHINFKITTMDLIKGVGAILTIGLFNFIVSFGLSLWVAMKSVNTPLKEWRKLLKVTSIFFLKNPIRFFFPMK